MAKILRLLRCEKKHRHLIFGLRFYSFGNLCLMISQMCWEAGKLGMEMSESLGGDYLPKGQPRSSTWGRTHPGTLDMTYLQLGKVILWWENRHQALGPAVQPCFFQWKNLWTRILWNDLKMFRMKSTESQRVDTNDMFHMWRLCRKIMLPKNDHNLDATPLIRSIHLTPEN